MMLHSILNNWTGLPGLPLAVVAYLLTVSHDAGVEDITLADVPNLVIQDMLNKHAGQKYTQNRQ
jgi:hypothetical protein